MADEPQRDEEPPIESAPEGASCSEHADRPALVICPRCGSFACLSCWHGALKRCHACVVRQPSPPVPFEDPSRNAIAGFFATLGDAGSPVITAPSFRHPGIGRALLFFVVTFPLLGALSGIVPYTALVLFGSSFAVTLQGQPSDDMLAFDVARAAGLGLMVALGQWLALTLPFVSLSNAFAEKGHPDAPLRAMLYRGWLLAAFLLAQYAMPLALPAAAGGTGALFAMLIAMVPFVLLLSTMRATTRMGSGVGALTALLTVAVPFAMMIGASYFLDRAVHAIVPELGQIAEQQRLEAERAEHAEQAPSQAGAPQPQPQAPQAQPQAPQAQPQAPQAQPQAQPEAPEAQPQAPQAQPEAPEAQPQAPQAQPEAPQAQPEAPEAQPQAPQAQPQAPQAQPPHTQPLGEGGTPT
ncbi:MAG: hypothetical protein U0353_15560 [Sandaracinus sp.]